MMMIVFWMIVLILGVVAFYVITVPLSLLAAITLVVLAAFVYCIFCTVRWHRLNSWQTKQQEKIKTCNTQRQHSRQLRQVINYVNFQKITELTIIVLQPIGRLGFTHWCIVKRGTETLETIKVLTGYPEDSLTGMIKRWSLELNGVVYNRSEIEYCTLNLDYSDYDKMPSIEQFGHAETDEWLNLKFLWRIGNTSIPIVLTINDLAMSITLSRETTTTYPEFDDVLKAALSEIGWDFNFKISWRDHPTEGEIMYNCKPENAPMVYNHLIEAASRTRVDFMFTLKPISPQTESKTSDKAEGGG